MYNNKANAWKSQPFLSCMAYYLAQPCAYNICAVLQDLTLLYLFFEGVAKLGGA